MVGLSSRLIIVKTSEIILVIITTIRHHVTIIITGIILCGSSGGWKERKGGQGAGPSASSWDRRSRGGRGSRVVYLGAAHSADFALHHQSALILRCKVVMKPCLGFVGVSVPITADIGALKTPEIVHHGDRKNCLWSMEGSSIQEPRKIPKLFAENRKMVSD